MATAELLLHYLVAFVCGGIAYYCVKVARSKNKEDTAEYLNKLLMYVMAACAVVIAICGMFSVTH